MLGYPRPSLNRRPPWVGSLQRQALSRWWLLASLVMLAGCAPLPLAAPAPEPFAHDAAFDPPRGDEQAADIFALTEPMRVYAQTLLDGSQLGDPRRKLIAALYGPQALQLHYDDSSTRTAAQAFDERAGNCLSLVLMTAAFAKHLGLPVSYQRVALDPSYARKAGLVMASSHVNLVLKLRPAAARRSRFEDADLVVDFLPGVDMARLQADVLSESQLVALFRNNRAAEHMAQGQLSEAYWWARAAVQADPGAAGPRNTLGVIYLRAGLLGAAEEAFTTVLQRRPDDLPALGNLAQTLTQLGRHAQAQALTQRLAQLQPQAPFADLDAGRRAMQAGDFEQALAHFEQELLQQPTLSELHFWLAQAHQKLGHQRRMLNHLHLAHDYSTSPSEARRFSDKLAAIATRLEHQP